MLKYDYAKLYGNYKRLANGPLPYAKKILLAHKYTGYRPDRVALQDASAQTAMLALLTTKSGVNVPASIHCDHLIQADSNLSIENTLKFSYSQHKEVYNFLQQAATKYGIDFYKPGCGIIHQIVFEKYAAPGILMLGCDSHTPNSGGLGCLAIGVGGMDAVEVMCGLEWDLAPQKIMGVYLHGNLPEWTSPKDLILYLLGKLGVHGGTGYIVEYFGPGVESLSCTGMATITNNGAEMGATTSVFPVSENMKDYLKATQRGHLIPEINKYSEYFTADKQVLDNPGQYYDKVVEIDLSALEPHLNGPFTPDHAIPISKMKQYLKENNLNDTISAALIGSCTNSSYQDMTKSAEIVKEMTKQEQTLKTEFLVTPGSEQIKQTLMRDDIISTFEAGGATILSNACGPCIGQWNRTTFDDSNIIVTSYNRNFKGRNDGNSKTMNFLASPEIVTALAYSGKLSFNPVTDKLNGKFLKAPIGDVLPQNGFVFENDFYPSNVKEQPDLEIKFDPKSSRLQEIKPFPAFNNQEINNLKILIKVVGKCTTDTISAAGPWLKYKGHLDNISENTLIGAMNADTNKINDAATPKQRGTIPEIAKLLKKQNLPWMIIADSNYGEGSAREHAAMQPRYLNCKVVLVKSFARIHETNLKKQGILPLTFENVKDYDLIKDVRLLNVRTKGLTTLKPNSRVELIFHKKMDGTVLVVKCKHTMTDLHLKWFNAGSSLNTLQ